jgi:hypothetical protein
MFNRSEENNLFDRELNEDDAIKEEIADIENVL